MQFNIYLHFSGQCEEAFAFYEKCLGGKMDQVFRFKDAPDSGQAPVNWANKIMHARMTIGEQVLMGMDAPPGRFQKPQGFHVNIASKDVAEGRKLFETLSEKGNVIMPFGPTFWAKGFAMFVDQFGIPWMINCE